MHLQSPSRNHTSKCFLWFMTQFSWCMCIYKNLFSHIVVQIKATKQLTKLAVFTLKSLYQKINLSATTVKGGWCASWNCPYHYPWIVFQTPRNIFKREKVKKQRRIIGILISISGNLNALTVLFIFNWVSYGKIIIYCKTGFLFQYMFIFTIDLSCFFWLRCFISLFWVLKFCFF